MLEYQSNLKDFKPWLHRNEHSLEINQSIISKGVNSDTKIDHVI